MEKVLDRGTTRTLDLLTALGHAVIATDPEGRITRWNAAAESLYGWKRDEVMGRPVVEVTPAEISRAQADEIMRAVAAGRLWSGEFQVRNREGKTFEVAVTDLPLMGNRQAVIGIVGVSSPSTSSTPLDDLLTGFTATANELWPSQIELATEGIAGVRVRACDPHVLQLLTILLIREADSLDSKNVVEIAATRPPESARSIFGIPETGVFIRISRKENLRRGSLLRDVARSIDGSSTAASLVRLARGTLFVGTGPQRAFGTYLYLPAA